MPRTGARKLASLPKRKAEFIEPMDCAPVTKLADGPEWSYEIKFDGYRAIVVNADGRVNLYSRRRKSFDHQYPLVVEALAELPEGMVVDGKVVALDESGRPNFNLLRRKLMKSVLKLRSPHLRIAEQFDATANDMIAAVRQQQLEGVVGKRKDSVYEA